MITKDPCPNSKPGDWNKPPPGPFVDPMFEKVWNEAAEITTDQDRLNAIVIPLKRELARAEERIAELEIELRAERIFGSRMFDKVVEYVRTALL